MDDLGRCVEMVSTEYPSVNKAHLRLMIEEEAKAEYMRIGSRRRSEESFYLPIADRISGWLRDAPDTRKQWKGRLSAFLASHRLACVWATLQDQEIK